jgi:hypothetical protein
MSGPAMAAVEGDGIWAEPALDETREGQVAGSKQGVGEVRHERKRVQGGPGLHHEITKALEKALAIAVGMEDPASLDAAYDDMMERARVVEAWSARHT